MRRLTVFKTNRILTALSKGKRKPLQKFIRELLKDGTHRYWSNEETLLVKSIELFCLEHDEFVYYAQDIIRFVGFDALLDLPERDYQIAVDLVEKGSEDFVLEAFNGIDRPTGLGRLSEAKSKLLLSAADKAEELGKDNIALCIYRVALLNEAYLDSEDSHPLIAAAQTGNILLGQAYSEAFNEHYHFRFVRYEKEYLEDLVLLGNAHLVELALNCNANIHAPTSTGQSLLDIAPNAETREVLLRYGAKTTNHEIYLLRQGILSIEQGDVNHEVMKEIFSVPKPLLKYSYHNTTHVSALPTTWDLVFTAAKYRSVDALTYMLPYLESSCTDDDLDKLLTALLGVDTMARAPQNHESAKQIIDVLQLLVSHKISFVDLWKMDDEDYRMTAGFNSKVARILNLACYNPENDDEYPDEDLVKIAMLLWRVGNIYGSPNGTRDMLLIGINHQKKFLLEACLAEFGQDFALLDTDQTTAVWNIVGNQLGKEEVTKELLQYAIENGADLNHQTIDGFTALHAAHRYGASMDFSPVKLLLAAGADRNIVDRFGRKPKDVPKEKFVFLSRGFVWPK